MSKYIIRLDDACEKRNLERWNRMEHLLDSYDIKPLVGVIPACKDKAMDIYADDADFWNRVDCWRIKGWVIAMHGYDHVYKTSSGGINPVNARSEFAGQSLEVQEEKIEKGVSIFREHGIEPKVFFAPSHTFDDNTLNAIKSKSNIRIISDTVANKAYCYNEITFVPQQSGRVRALPFDTVTFCYHPNIMSDEAFIELELFIKKHKDKFISFPLTETSRKKNFFDKILHALYFARR